MISLRLFIEKSLKILKRNDIIYLSIVDLEIPSYEEMWRMLMENNKISRWINQHFHLSISLAYGFVVLFGVWFCYHFLPILLNYGPGTINTEFDKSFSGGLTYFIQFVLIFFAVFFVGTITLAIQTKDFKNINKYLNNPSSKDSKEKLNAIKAKCISIPQDIFLLLAFIPPIGVSVVFYLLNFTSFADFKVLLIVSLTVLLVASIGYLILKGLFKSVLTYINNTEKPQKTLKLSLVTTLLMQFFPLIIICTLYTYLLTYSTSITDKAKSVKAYYTYAISQTLANTQATNIEALETDLSNLPFLTKEDAVFLIDQNNQFINFNQTEVNDFFIEYALKLAEQYDNIVYDYYGTDTQGIIIPITFQGENIKIVIRYALSPGFSTFIVTNIMLVLFFCVIFSIYFSKSLANDIKMVTDSMSDLVHNNDKSLNQIIPVTSNDEIGDLVIAFNQIQDLTNKNITEIESSQQTLMEKERLASLGQLIGGIAHNMKTPIMSISGAAEGLTELVSEYVASVDNPIVTKEDHKEIAKDMLDWITKIKTHTAYMSDILTTVKGQASQLTTSASDSFTVYDLTKRVDILMKHEIKKALLTLDTNIYCDPAQIIKGDINNLIQVVNNLITNAIQAYNGKVDEHIELNINTKNNYVIIQVRDYGCGMTDEVKSKLFKEMITTKGKNGTGLGLYMSYSTIRGKFNGDMRFESEIGVGTTFEIRIPI